MNSYQKLANLKKETDFQLRIIKKHLEKTKGTTLEPSMYIQGLLEDLFKLYEIK